jgi:UDP-GlcNAc:undecaprenyl-phosphate/decaprenyl-phosphate GlcNAc-1-phosphate transferase
VSSYAVVFAVAALTTFATTPLVRRVAIRAGAVVSPSDRRVHAAPTPTLGGAAMLLGLLAAMAVAWRLEGLDAAFTATTAPLGVCIAAAVIFATGLIDDLVEVSAPAKLAGMVLAGAILSLAGVSTIFFRVPFLGIFSLTPDLSAFITVLWVVGMANAVNLIDGLDGLAAGIMAIASGAFFLYGIRLEDVDVLAQGNIGPLLAVIVLGICLGFLPHNFHPARIFMGDSGALLLGLLMAASTMAVGGSTDAEFSGQSFFFFAPLFIPLVILGVPVLDTAFAIVRRATRRTGVAEADKEHLHHRLMRLGHGQRRSVLILWSCTRPTQDEATPTCRSASPPSAWSCTPSSTPACAGSGPSPPPNRQARTTARAAPRRRAALEATPPRARCAASAAGTPAVLAAAPVHADSPSAGPLTARHTRGVAPTPPPMAAFSTAD